MPKATLVTSFVYLSIDSFWAGGFNFFFLISKRNIIKKRKA
jgi:hypothetical protein